MQKSLSSKSAGPKSEFASLVAETLPRFSKRAPSPLDWFALVWPPRLKANCLLTRHPVLTLLPSHGKTLLTLQLRWLTWQAQRHGYAINVVKPNELSTLQKDSYHLLCSEPQAKVNFIGHSVSETVLPHLSWISPLTALDQLLELLNQLAEADYHRDT